MKNYSIFLFILILVTTSCQTNSTRIQGKNATDKANPATEQTNENSGENNNCLVTEPCVLFMYPDTSEINEMQAKYDEETYAEIVADLTWYPGIAGEVLDSFGIKNMICDAKYIVLKTSDNTELKFERKKLKGNMVLFHPDKEPIISSAIDFDRDLTLAYFKNPETKITSLEFVKTIDSLGYFKYADPEHVDSLKQEIAKYFEIDNALTSVWDDKTHTPLDYRYYFCDGEAVFELGGFTNMLEKLQPTFDKIGFTITITNHIEEWDNENNWLNHSITINGTNYIIFEHYKGYGWGKAVQRLAEILNAEFKKQGISDKIYLISSGNDGMLIFLTDELHKYIDKFYTNSKWKPLDVVEWVEVMEVE